MRFRKVFICFFFFLITKNALTDETPTLFLQEGTNEVNLSVLNKWNTDLTDISFELDELKLPIWLNVYVIDKSINVKRGVQYPENIKLTFEVHNAPTEAFIEIPYTLKDNKGNIWNFFVNVKIAQIKESNSDAINALYENFPNPFNPITTVSFSIKEEGHIKLVIYNSLGQEVRTLFDTHFKSGIHSVQWDARNNLGQNVSSGLYLYRLSAGSFVQTRRMLLIE